MTFGPRKVREISAAARAQRRRYGPRRRRARHRTSGRSGPSVSVADAWPNMLCTPFTLAPDAMAMDAAVWRSSCGMKPSRPTARAAASNRPRRKFPTVSTPPRGREHELVGRLPGYVDHEAIAQERGHRHRTSLMRLRRTEQDPAADLRHRCRTQGRVRRGAASFSRAEVEQPHDVVMAVADRD